MHDISFISVLDTIRLLILNERFSNDLFGGSYADEFVGKLLAVIRFVTFWGYILTDLVKCSISASP